MVHWWRWLPAAGWMGLIFYLSSQTGNELQGMFPFFDSLNFGHVVAYFVLSLLFYWALFPLRGKVKVDIRLISIGLSLLYGISDEWHQSYVPGRMPDALDIVNDVVGAILGMAAVTFYHKKLRKP